MGSHDLLTRAQMEAYAESLGWTTLPIMEPVRNGVNLVYRCVADDGTWYLRVVDSEWRSAAAGEAEVTLVEVLRGRGAPLVPFRMASGRGVVIDSPRHWGICSAAAPGTVCDPPNAGGYARLGNALAQLHRSADGLPRPQLLAADGIPEQPLSVMAPTWMLWPDATELPLLVAQLDQWCRVHLDDRGIIHGDAHAGNCAFADDTTTFFDTECSGWGPRGYDLAVVHGTLTRHFPIASDREQRWRAFLDGYATVRPLSDNSLRVIPMCLALRRLWLLLVAARMPWRYHPERFLTLGRDASAVIAKAIEGWSTV